MIRASRRFRSMSGSGLKSSPAIASASNAKVRPLATEQQIIELAAPVGIETHDFAIEDGTAGAHCVGNFFSEIRPTLELMTVTRDELTMMTVDVR
jgi:hypothetical protein